MPESNQKTILVADDEPSIRTFVSQLLSRNYNVLTAASGDDALQKAAEYAGVIDLVISNVQMPGMTGIELGTKLNLERPNLRVMLMSGFTSGMLILNDGWHFLHKPFLPSQLLELVAGILAREVTQSETYDEHKSLGINGN